MESFSRNGGGVITGSRTFFSSEAFVKAWVSGHGMSTRPITIDLGSDTAQSFIHGIVKPWSGGVVAEFSVDGLYACPEPLLANSGNELARALRELIRNEFLWVVLNVRFDHEDLASQLQDADLSPVENICHVLKLDKSHDELFAAYRRTTRQEIKRCTRKYGVQIRRAINDEDVAKYCAVHEKLARQKKGFRVKYPYSLISELLKLREHATLLIGEYEGQVVAGTLFFRDGDSMLAWHSAADREYAHLDISPAIMDSGIQLACELGLTTFNLGASRTDSLRFFKTSFGAVPRKNWYFCLSSHRSLFKRTMNRCLAYKSWLGDARVPGWL